MHVTNETYLIQGRTTPNSSKRKFRCTKYRPCKRVAICFSCYLKRKLSFVDKASEYALKHGLTQFLTISWPLLAGEDSWEKLRFWCARISKKRHGGKYIRFSGIGQKETPHIHLIVGETSAAKIRKFARKVGPSETLTQIKPVTDIRRLFGYLYDQNFLVLMKKLNKPKRLRLVSGSQGLSYGFPSNRPTYLDSKEET